MSHLINVWYTFGIWDSNVGLSLHTVNSVTECEAVMEQGWKNRTVGATLMNADSSRSHSIFTIHVEQMETGRGKHIRKVP